MGKVSKDATGEPIEGPGFEGRYGETEGYTIGFEKYSEHADMTPLFVLAGPTRVCDPSSSDRSRPALLSVRTCRAARSRLDLAHD